MRPRSKKFSDPLSFHDLKIGPNKRLKNLSARLRKEYIERGQIYFGFEVDEKLLPFAIEEFGDQCWVYGSDIPHGDRLYGAVDVFLTPVIMKRSRPGTVLTALCPRGRVDDLTRVLFEESSTIGVRWTEWQRTALAREVVTLATSYGAIPFKVSRLEGRVVTVTPEFADIARIARDKALPVREVLDQARAEGRRLLGGSRRAAGFPRLSERWGGVRGPVEAPHCVD